MFFVSVIFMFDFTKFIRYCLFEIDIRLHDSFNQNNTNITNIKTYINKKKVQRQTLYVTFLSFSFFLNLIFKFLFPFDQMKFSVSKYKFYFHHINYKKINIKY